MRRALLVAAVGLALSVTSCLGARAFQCQSSDECDLGDAQGVCEANGYCGYPDDDCESGRRYESEAPDGLGGTCVESSSGESSSGDGGSSEESTGSSGPSQQCIDYCIDYITNCNMVDAGFGYANSTECQQHCAQWLPGTVGANQGDSVACRAYYASMATGDESRAELCHDASPSGGESCVNAGEPTCAEYCAAFTAACGTEDYINEECGGWWPGHRGDMSGHSIACRLYWVGEVPGNASLCSGSAGASGIPDCVLPLL